MSRFGLKVLLTNYGKLARSEAGLSVNIRLCNRYYSVPTNYWYYCKRTNIIINNQTDINDIIIYYCGHARHNELYHVKYDVNKVYSQITNYRYKIYNMGTKIVSRESSSEYRLQINSTTPITIITKYGSKAVIKFRMYLNYSYRKLVWQEALHMPLYKYVDDDGTITMNSPFAIGKSNENADVDIWLMFKDYKMQPQTLKEYEWPSPV
jgi:hypothetical protein